jgi:hypothetical protein
MYTNHHGDRRHHSEIIKEIEVPWCNLIHCRTIKQEFLCITHKALLHRFSVLSFTVIIIVIWFYLYEELLNTFAAYIKSVGYNFSNLHYHHGCNCCHTNIFYTKCIGMFMIISIPDFKC